MNTNNIPTVEILSRKELINFLKENSPTYIFENVEETSNPVGKQFNYKLTTRINNELFKDVIVIYKEAFFEANNIEELYTQNWLLKELSPEIKFYRGIIRP